MYCIRCGNGRLVRGPCDGARGQTKATLKAFEVRRDDGRRWHNRFDIVHLLIAVVDVALGKQIFLATGDKLCALSPYWTSKVYLYFADEGQVYQANFFSQKETSSSLSSGRRESYVFQQRKPFDRRGTDDGDGDGGSTLKLTRLPHLHRVQRIFADYKGQNRMAIASNPLAGWVLKNSNRGIVNVFFIVRVFRFPLLSASLLKSDLERLLDDVDPFDSIHDYHLQVIQRSSVLPSPSTSCTRLVSSKIVTRRKSFPPCPSPYPCKCQRSLPSLI